MRFWPRKFNDLLALLIIVGLPVYWAAFRPEDIVVGTTLGGWTLVCQFYFRKAQGEPEAKP